jgi:hypothetical protein
VVLDPDEQARCPIAGQDLVDGAGCNTTTPREDRNAVAHLFHLGEDVTRDEYGPAFAAESPDQLAHFLDAGWVEAVGRLVQDQQFGVLEQRRADPEPLLHPQRVGLDPVPAPIRQSNDAQNLLDGASPDPIGGSEELEILSTRVAREHCRGLDDGAYLRYGTG